MKALFFLMVYFPISVFVGFDFLFRFTSAKVSQTLKLLQDIRALAPTNESEGLVSPTNQ